MILDAEDRDDSWFSERFNVCVVGTGPAGITLSRALAKRGHDVCLLEGGGQTLYQESQDLYQGDVVGFNYVPLETARLRFFGGTSNHWTGWSRPLDAWDFGARDVNPNSGWPISKSDLDPYAQETDEILDLGRSSQSSRYFKADVAPFLPADFRWSPPTRFGRKYAPELASSNRVRVYLNSNLVDIELDDTRRQVSQLTFKSFRKDGAFRIRANYFALCLGGIENARVLLNTQSGDRYAIGNQNDLVGRYFSEHLHYQLGSILFQKEPSRRVFLAPTPEMLDRFSILNFALRVKPPKQSPRSTLRDIGCSTSFTQKLAEAIGLSPDCNPLGSLKIASEQALNLNSRLKLTDKVDRFGLHRVALDWRLSDIDYRTMRAAAIQCGCLFARRKLGRVRLQDWVLEQAANLPPLGKAETLGYHHMCTTRMSAHPPHGVVDSNCRVHEIENLYLGGSSVFATGGYSNPTYTIVQLALRLGDHLDDRLG
jgi:choline dehydrogenase-like flavoprotein